MPRDPTETRKRIRHAAAQVLADAGPVAFTTERVAERAACAKGLVHYHYRTKADLLTAVVEEAGAARVARFERALIADDAIGASWTALRQEAESRLLAATAAHGGELPAVAAAQRAADLALAEALGQAAERVLERDRLYLRVPAQNVGHLLVSLIQGTVAQLAAGGDVGSLEEAYATGWLGILSLGVRR